MDVYHIGNYSRENTQNQEKNHIQSIYVQGILVFGILFLIAV